MIDDHNIKEKVSVKNFLKKFNSYSTKSLEVTAHTFIRLSEKQRKLYKEEELINSIYSTKPIEVSIQKNGIYAVIYPFEGRLLKVLFDISSSKIYIVTFYILNKVQEEEVGK